MARRPLRRMKLVGRPRGTDRGTAPHFRGADAVSRQEHFCKLCVLGATLFSQYPVSALLTTPCWTPLHAPMCTLKRRLPYRSTRQIGNVNPSERLKPRPDGVRQVTSPALLARPRCFHDLA